MFHVCLRYTVQPLITCLERAHLLAVLCVMFHCVFVTFPYGVSGTAWYLIVSIADLFPDLLLLCWIT